MSHPLRTMNVDGGSTHGTEAPEPLRRHREGAARARPARAVPAVQPRRRRHRRTSPGPRPSASGVLRVAEKPGGATVPELTVHNTGALPLLLLEGETLVGAKQNRTLDASVLVPAGAAADIAVSCVEAGRWGAPRASSRSVRHAPADLRRVKTATIAREQMRSRKQAAVWSRIAQYEEHARRGVAHERDGGRRRVARGRRVVAGGRHPTARPTSAESRSPSAPRCGASTASTSRRPSPSTGTRSSPATRSTRSAPRRRRRTRAGGGGGLRPRRPCGTPDTRRARRVSARRRPSRATASWAPSCAGSTHSCTSRPSWTRLSALPMPAGSRARPVRPIRPRWSR